MSHLIEKNKLNIPECLQEVAVQNLLGETQGDQARAGLTRTVRGWFVKSVKLTDVVLSELNSILTLPVCYLFCLRIHNIYRLVCKTQ